MKLLLVMISFFTISGFAQQSKSEKELFLYLDNTINLENTDLSYGAIYLEKFRALNEAHQYFESKNFTSGKINYQKLPFFNIPALYNVAQDELIIKINNESIVLEKAFVLNFTIHNKKFIKNSVLGYCEEIFNSKKINFYKKHYKNKVKKLDRNFVYYRFSDKHEYFLNIDNNLTKITNKKSLYKALPKKKKEIQDFYKKQKTLLKSNIDVFYNTLLIQLFTKDKTI